MKLPTLDFPTRFEEIWAKVNAVDPIKYGKTRNFIWGAVTYLSPYISRGVISVEDVRSVVMKKVESPWEIEKFLQELAWREYWQRIWLVRGDGIFNSMKRPQPRRRTDFPLNAVPQAVLNSETGIEALDKGIQHLSAAGYMHNHLRMYLASVWCNVGGYSWQEGAKWMYYHLLDGDIASNWLSWQWVCGTNSSKLYFCNQENINKYCGTKDAGTFLDFSYDVLAEEPIRVPQALEEYGNMNYSESFVYEGVRVITAAKELGFTGNEEVLVYHWYHLDPRWMEDSSAKRIFLVEPSFLMRFPVSKVVLNFVISLALEIPNIQIAYCEFSELKVEFPHIDFVTREHPIANLWGIRYTERIWMSSNENVEGSFFNYWKKSSREIMKR